MFPSSSLALVLCLLVTLTAPRGSMSPLDCRHPQGILRHPQGYSWGLRQLRHTHTLPLTAPFPTSPPPSHLICGSPGAPFLNKLPSVLPVPLPETQQLLPFPSPPCPKLEGADFSLLPWTLPHSDTKNPPPLGLIPPSFASFHPSRYGCRFCPFLGDFRVPLGDSSNFVIS